jgi:hypothetical protein
VQALAKIANHEARRRLPAAGQRLERIALASSHRRARRSFYAGLSGNATGFYRRVCAHTGRKNEDCNRLQYLSI